MGLFDGFRSDYLADSELCSIELHRVSPLPKLLFFHYIAKPLPLRTDTQAFWKITSYMVVSK